MRRAPAWIVVPAGLAVAFVALPVVALAARAPWSDAISVLRAASSREAVALSLAVSLAAALVALVLGLPLAWTLARSRARGLALVRGLVALPLVLPPVVAGVGLLAALGRNGLLGPLLSAGGVTLPFSTAGAVVASAFVALPLVVLTAEAGIRAADPRLEDAAATMGASRWYALRRVTLPLIRPHLAAGLVLAWARALGEFGATITFAGNLRGRTQTLPLAVFEAFQTDPGAAIVLSLLLSGLSFAALVAVRGRIASR